jgi:hypothetical protein
VINIEHKTSNYKKKNNQKTLHIHWPFHPKGLQHQDIRQEYCKTLQPALDYKRMQIAISRPKNLRDILAKSALKLPPNMDIHKLIHANRKELNSN